MSIPTTASSVLSIARAELGTHESPSGSNRQKYGAWAGRNGVAWCAIFVTWVFARAGYDWRSKIAGFAYTPMLNAKLQSLGFKRVPPERARAGDIVFFDFPDSVRRIQHVGIVADNDLVHRSLRTYEGNTSVTSDDNGGEVMERHRGYSLTASILRPPYAVIRKPVLTRVLRLRLPRMSGADVLAVRRALGMKPWPFYDNGLAGAVKRWQKSKGLVADGEFGPASARAAGFEWRG